MGIALGLLTTRLPGISRRDAVTIAIPSAVYGLLMFAFGAALVYSGRWRFAADVTPAPAPADS